jgi:hypothetical protein
MKSYVYRCTHKETNEFYIGYRFANKVPPVDDLGIYYFTSSKFVKPRFNEFNYEILAEFDDSSLAHEFEQKLILENWKIKGLLNRVVHTSNETHYKMQKFGKDNPATRPEVIEKIKAERAKQVFSKESQLKKSKTMSGIPKPKVTCPHCGKVGGCSAMGKWHFDKCKHKVD